MDSVLSININVLKSVNDCNVSTMLAYKKDLKEQAVSDYHGGTGIQDVDLATRPRT